jgi:probable addiction module antidote protein
MNTVFIGGSRHVSRLPANARERLNNVIESGFRVLVGDANGADKAVQKHLLDANYDQVTVFCSGGTCRNNLGQWKTTNITAAKNSKGFEFYAAKDREMARAADFGLMIWDGKSAGTILNVLRLVRAGKKAVLINVPEKSATTFKAAKDWEAFLSRCSFELRNDLRERATPEEWELSAPLQPGLLDASPTEPSRPDVFDAIDEDLAIAIEGALASTDHKAVVDLLGRIAKARGMSQVAKDTGLAREALYRALRADGNPEFATVLKVINSVGLRLTVNRPG